MFSENDHGCVVEVVAVPGRRTVDIRCVAASVAVVRTRRVLGPASSLRSLGRGSRAGVVCCGTAGSSARTTRRRVVAGFHCVGEPAEAFLLLAGPSAFAVPRFQFGTELLKDTFLNGSASRWSNNIEQSGR